MPTTRPVPPTEPEIALPALWNPRAAAAWSLLLSPLFGIVLHMLNWHALAKAEERRAATGWLIAAVIVILPTLYAGIVAQEWITATSLLVMNILYYGLMFFWYVVSGREQVRYVTDVLDHRYRRRRWGMPLGAAAGLYALLGVVSVIDAFVDHYGPGL